jgi:hypothetical protein
MGGLFATLTACSALFAVCGTAKPITTADGSIAHLITCNATLPTMCVEKAGQLCPFGFSILSTSGSVTLQQLATNLRVMEAAEGTQKDSMNEVYSGTMAMPSMLVQCKPKKYETDAGKSE